MVESREGGATFQDIVCVVVDVFLFLWVRFV